MELSLLFSESHRRSDFSNQKDSSESEDCSSGRNAVFSKSESFVFVFVFVDFSLCKFSLKSCPEVATEQMNCDHTTKISFYDSQTYPLSYNVVLQEAAGKLENVW